MRTLLEILGLRTPQRGREPVALPRSIRWTIPLLLVTTTVVGVLLARILGRILWALVAP